MRMYHGTTADFDAFQPSYRKGEQLGFGVHLTPDKKLAGLYAYDPAVSRKGKHPRVITVDVPSLKTLDADKIYSEGSEEYALAKKLAPRSPVLFQPGYDEQGNKTERTVYMQAAIDASSGKRAEQILKKHGYEAVLYMAEVIEPTGGGYYKSVRKAPTLVVLYPEKLKIIKETSNPSYDIPPAPDEEAFLTQIARMKQAERRWRDMADEAKAAGRDWKHPFLQWHEIGSDIYQMIGLRPVQLGHRLFAKGALAVEFTDPKYPGKRDIVSRVPQPGRRNEWRVTNIWSDGKPGGHIEKRTLLEALREVGRGMRPTRAAFPTEQPDMVSNPPAIKRGLRVRIQTPLHGALEGVVDKPWGAGQWMVKTADGRTFILPPTDMEVVGKAPKRSGRSENNAALVDAYLAAHPNLPVLGRFAGGEQVLRVVYDVRGGELMGNQLDLVGLPIHPGLFGYHFTDEPESWIRVLEDDFDRDPKKAKIVAVTALPGDAWVEDVQQAMPSEAFGRTLDSAILITGREFLRRGKDWRRA